MEAFAETDLFRGGVGIPLVLKYPQFVTEPQKALPDFDDHVLFFEAVIDERGKKMRYNRSRTAKKSVPRIGGRLSQHAGIRGLRQADIYFFSHNNTPSDVPVVIGAAADGNGVAVGDTRNHTGGRPHVTLDHMDRVGTVRVPQRCEMDFSVGIVLPEYPF